MSHYVFLPENVFFQVLNASKYLLHSTVRCIHSFVILLQKHFAEHATVPGHRACRNLWMVILSCCVVIRTESAQNKVFFYANMIPILWAVCIFCSRFLCNCFIWPVVGVCWYSILLKWIQVISARLLELTVFGLCLTLMTDE